MICRPLGNMHIIIMIIMIFALCFDAAYVTLHIFNSVHELCERRTFFTLKMCVLFWF